MKKESIEKIKKEMEEIGKVKLTKRELKKLEGLRKKMFLNNTGTPHCVHCGKPFVNAYDSISKKVSEYLWKPNCKCFGKEPGFRLAML